MYPYDFVPVDMERAVQRRPYQPHNRFAGFSGRIEGEIEALTPLFLPETNPAKLKGTRYKPFLTNRGGESIIPGSSLKGLMRSLVETLGPGCWWLFDGLYDTARYEHRLPSTFKQCSDPCQLCVACRMFGLIKDNTLLLGHVGFDDAVCAAPLPHEPLYTIILGGPKPRHKAYYLTPDGKQVAGRKFYYHSAEPPTDAKRWLPPGAPQEKPAQNAYIRPVGPGSTFTFSAHFDSLRADELQLLLYALVLEPEMRHKLGYAKPAGLGSVEIRLTSLELLDYTMRYTSATSGTTVYTGPALLAYLGGQIAQYVQDRTSITLQELRRIWRWPGYSGLHYPDYSWFKDPANAKLRLNQIP